MTTFPKNKDSNNVSDPHNSIIPEIGDSFSQSSHNSIIAEKPDLAHLTSTLQGLGYTIVKHGGYYTAFGISPSSERIATLWHNDLAITLHDLRLFDLQEYLYGMFCGSYSTLFPDPGIIRTCAILALTNFAVAQANNLPEVF